MSKNGIDFVIVSIVTDDAYDLALDILNKYEKLALIPDKFGVTAMCMLVGKTSVFISGSQNEIWQQFNRGDIFFAGYAAVIVNIRKERVVTLPEIAIIWELVVMVMMYSIDHICGTHFNPAVTIVFTTCCRFPLKQVTTVAQITFGGVMFINHFIIRNRVNKVIKDQKELTYLTREALEAQKLIKEIDAEGSN
ncbi:hypothetical protein GIB67_011851 [Kingdonia uniflora]|uniref:Uncharacterized protein n=1 Tax=Kingdonia uniflora TaxID=39325 RepID=A0A7J7MK07_9MAGN|nr:hypothetical protein GIB67_011851 [Kingdonia uniflora]